jgi:hypothetical protein
LNSFASADTSTASRPDLTDARRECLSEPDVTAPAHDEGSPGRSPSPYEQRREVAVPCGLTGPNPRMAGRRLTDDERACLAEHGATRAGRPAGPEARAAFRAAAEACDLPTPGARADHRTI